MHTGKTFRDVISGYRLNSFSERDKGDRFERLVQRYFKTDPKYATQLAEIWLWNEFPSREDFGGTDTGIDLVAKTNDGEYWAIQCKCLQENTPIDKPAVDTFLSTSGKDFQGENMQITRFANRYWVSTTNNWGSNAEQAIQNQNPPVNRINLHELEEAAVNWEEIDNGIFGEKARATRKQTRPHQAVAIGNAIEYFKTADRGKLIMACGTGKTYTALRVAEQQTKGKGLVLFLVPSIALLGQTLNEWFADAEDRINAICICSDPEVSKKKSKKDDSEDISIVDLALPASTNVHDIVKQFHRLQNSKQPGMTVVFSTYQSIKVISDAQKELLNQKINGIFDLIICDEAHRTTGVTLAKEDESAFVKVHDNTFLQAKKRMYMTATPRLYSDSSKSKAAQAEAVVVSMDGPEYGDEMYRIGFGKAVEEGLLSDYKVLILTVSDKDMPLAIQKMVADPNNEINSDDASKLIGCINALAKNMLGDNDVLKNTDPAPMRTAVAFCQNIEVSKKISAAFNETSNIYNESVSAEQREKLISIQSEHVDGTMGATLRDKKLSWMKAVEPEAGECRILTNVRCLSEGVDVPSLDAVLFLSARNSEVDVVQSVGRVMRKAPGKKYGYIIIPIVIPADVEPNKALDDNDRYRVVWTVLNALRAHDDRFNATVNKIELNKNRPDQILVGQPDYGERGSERESGNSVGDLARQLSLQFQQLQGVVFAKMVQKVGDRRYWEQWAKEVAGIAERHIERINRLIKSNYQHEIIFTQFMLGLHKNINPSITQDEAVEMLAQHIITKPVFEALFEGYSFVKNNAISVSMQNMMDLLEEQSLDKDLQSLDKFYEAVKKNASGIDNAAGRQKIIIELYDKFFKTAFPRMVEKLGIVYTPVEVVDFIVHSVEALLQKEFGRSVSDENVHILDPFTGTGTFMTRLLQSGLIKAKDLERKYKHELHANEIVLLAYYIAAINIENTYHDLTAHKEFQSFDGICLTDTFQLGETDDSEQLFSKMFPQNSKRVQAQKKAPLQVIMGNPPYSVGQKSANDNAQNQSYTILDSRIAKTYAAETDATNKNSLYDSYIKAFRWSTDRLDKNGGIIAFVSNGAWLDGNSADGFRKCLQREFSGIYVFNLRGNQRTSGELSRQEGGKIFGSGSRTPIAITFLIKKPNLKDTPATIYYHDIGDYLSREEKLNIIRKLGSIDNPKMELQTLQPNENGDWLNHRNDVFETFVAIGNKDDKQSTTFFNLTYSRGVATSRDNWCYNTSAKHLQNSIKRALDFYNEQREAYLNAKSKNPNLKARNFISFDDTKFSWSDNPINGIETNKEYKFDLASVVTSVYRPFFKQKLYFDRTLNERVYQMPKLFPNAQLKNKVICVSGVGASKDFSCLMTDCVPDLQLQFNGQCFPLYYYEEQDKKARTLFDTPGEQKDYIKRDGVSDFILGQAVKIYGKNVGKEDIFYYVYGLLHSPDYRTRFANDLKKMLPRIPLVDEPKEFWAFSKAGRKLAELHIEYEKVAAAESVDVQGAESGNYRVEKMRFPSKEDKSTIIYNSIITISNIPAKAYEYVVNGKSAIEWIMERYQVTVNKDSGIKNDPNDWADEVGNPRYILDLLLSVINLSVQTVDIVAGLPTLKGLGEEPAKVEEVEEDQQIFKQLSELDKADNWFDSLSVLNKYCNELLNNEQYDDCNRFIADFLNREFSLRLHLGLLTATNRRKKHLESRNLLYEKAKELALEVMTPEQTKTALRQLA